jgi:hypothetical protein
MIRPEVAILSGFFVLVLSSFSFASDETIPPDSWIYPALDLFELRGLVTLEPYMPYSRSTVAYYLDRILTRLEKGDITLTSRQRFLLGRLCDEFLGRASRPQDREDRPIVVYREGGCFAAIDVTVGGAVRKDVDRDKGEVDGMFMPSIILDLGRRLTLETGYRVRIEPERDQYFRGRKPSAREKSFRGVTSEFERGYLAARGSRWSVLVGRDYVHWGGGRTEGLLLSRTAGSLDHVSAAFAVGRFRLSTVHALLDPSLPRYLAGHRLTIRLPGDCYLGVSESVIYTRRNFDFAYLMPTVSYYANQYNELGDDNVLWGVDIKLPVWRGLQLYGEFLIDDLQYESDPPAPNRVAYNVAAEALVPLGERDTQIFADYTFIDIFTYAHKDSLFTHYVAGDGGYPFNPILGSPLGPDADRWRFHIRTTLHRRVTVGIEGSFIRRGEGNDLMEWNREEDPDPPFPSGDRIRENRYGTSCSIDLEGGSMIAAGGGWVDRSWTGVEQRESFAFLEVAIDF